MTSEAEPGSPVVSEGTVPAFATGVHLRRDWARGRWVLLAPERIVVPDPVCLEVLRSVDGRASVGTIVGSLTERYDADRGTIRRDVIDLLLRLRSHGWLVWS